jgi:hypothetical protein
MVGHGSDIAFALTFFVLLSVGGTLALRLTRNHSETVGFQTRLLVCAFACRFLAAVAIYEFGLVRVLGDEDAGGWTVGASLRQAWLQRGVGLFDLPAVLTEIYTGQHQGYRYMLGALFYLTDSPARLTAAALNCFFGAVTVVLAYRIARSLFSEWVAVRVGWWSCVFPALIIWSAQTVKEPVVILLETLALYGCIRIKLSGFSARHVPLCAAAILLLVPFRFYAAYIAGAAVVLALALPHLTRRKITVGSALGVVSLVVPILVVSGVLAQQEALLENYNLRRIERFRQDVATGSGSGVRNVYDLETPDGFALGTLDGAAHLMLAPFPWELIGGSQRLLLTIPELVVWYWLFFAGVLPGLWYAVRKRFSDAQPLLFFIIALGLLYSLMFGNIGLIYRQRAQLLPWLLVFAMVGMERRVLRRRAAASPIAGQVLAEAQR